MRLRRGFAPGATVINLMAASSDCRRGGGRVWRGGSPGTDATVAPASGGVLRAGTLGFSWRRMRRRATWLCQFARRIMGCKVASRTTSWRHGRRSPSSPRPSRSTRRHSAASSGACRFGSASGAQGRLLRQRRHSWRLAPPTETLTSARTTSAPSAWIGLSSPSRRVAATSFAAVASGSGCGGPRRAQLAVPWSRWATSPAPTAYLSRASTLYRARRDGRSSLWPAPWPSRSC
mmetsp:Transcript_122351/g.351550  ORF Transcript_122351/g.351550 Transcript_122351/m.351550 type:complete len:233 (+) Transcript_122351:504-1202(+)